MPVGRAAASGSVHDRTLLRCLPRTGEGRVGVRVVAMERLRRRKDFLAVGTGPSAPTPGWVGGSVEEEAVRKVKSIALQVLADMVESGEEVPTALRALFAA